MLQLNGAAKSLITGKTFRLCRCWRIDRQDGVTLRFTDHDHDLVLDGYVYEAAGGFSSSAESSKDSFRGQDVEVVGMITSDAITEDDLADGRYRGAVITLYHVDWKYPWVGAIRSTKFFLLDTTFTGQQWNAPLAGITHQFKQRKGHTFQRNCRYTFGDTKCGISLASITSTVATVSAATDRKTFTASHSDFSGAALDRYAYGVLVWTSGDNLGLKGIVRTSAAASGTSIDFILFQKMAQPISVSDEFSIYPGCDRLLATCRDKFSNILNFGGFPTIPGNDKIWQSPEK